VTDQARPPGSTLPRLWLARHGATAWSRTGQHTGLTDLPLSERGEQEARLLGSCLQGQGFRQVFTSPLQRASRSCALAGFSALGSTDADLVEWDYGQYEGLTRAQILAQQPGWQLFRDGCPGGESPAQVAGRADRVVARVRALAGDTLLFSSGHLLRMLAARWLGLAAPAGALLTLDTASLGVLGYEHTLAAPVIRRWNDTAHLRTTTGDQP
jgi:probable phosphoglycerate mutase